MGPPCPFRSAQARMRADAAAYRSRQTMIDALTPRRPPLRPPCRAASSAALRPPPPGRAGRQGCRRAHGHPRGAGDPAGHPCDRRRPGGARRARHPPLLMLGVLTLRRLSRADPARRLLCSPHQVDHLSTCTRTCSGCRWPSTTGWASGQLLSRATTDLSTIRWFVAFSGIFLVVNASRSSSASGCCCGSRLALGLVVRSRPARSWSPRWRSSAALLGWRRPPDPGPGRRPHDDRRGVGARHPGAQGVRPGRGLRRRLRRRRPRPARHQLRKVRLLAALWRVLVP